MFLVPGYLFMAGCKSSKHGLFFMSRGVCDQISSALYFNIFLPEFECAFNAIVAF